jgi:hypothetical protein
MYRWASVPTNLEKDCIGRERYCPFHHDDLFWWAPSRIVASHSNETVIRKRLSGSVEFGRPLDRRGH